MKSPSWYYLASLVFLAGLLLSVTGIAFSIYVNLSRISDPGEIRLAFGLIGVGLAVTLTGLNMMIRFRSEYSTYAVIAGFLLSSAGIAGFIFIYPDLWYYPNVSYVVTAYTVGIALLVGNSFANVVLNLIEKKPVMREEFSPEEIEKEVERVIDESMRRIIEFSDSGLRFRDVDTAGFRLGRTFDEKRGEMRVIGDSVPEVEALRLLKTGTIEVDDKEIDTDSKLLKEVISREEDRKKGFGFLRRWKHG
jgi:hypothetical protein